MQKQESNSKLSSFTKNRCVKLLIPAIEDVVKHLKSVDCNKINSALIYLSLSAGSSVISIILLLSVLIIVLTSPDFENIEFATQELRYKATFGLTILFWLVGWLLHQKGRKITLS